MGVTSLNVTADPVTNYSCTVRAATSVGDGPATAVISGVTDEDSECIVSIYRNKIQKNDSLYFWSILL